MSDVTKKLVTFILIMLIAIVAIIGCVYVVMKMNVTQGNPNVSSAVNTVELSAAEINRKVIEKMEYKGISELASGDISSHIDIPEDSVTQASIYISDSSASATEIACFKLVDPNGDNTDLMLAITDHISAKQKGFQDSPKESEYIKNYVLITSNGYVFLAISENPDLAGKTFEDIVGN